jgi:hypothetical protein
MVTTVKSPARAAKIMKSTMAIATSIDILPRMFFVVMSLRLLMLVLMIIGIGSSIFNCIRLRRPPAAAVCFRVCARSRRFLI